MELQKQGYKNCPDCLPWITSADEFPYAITEEGGSNAVCSCTPIWEQEIQKSQLSRLVLSNKFRKGDIFMVILDDKGPIPAPDNHPIIIPPVAPSTVPGLIPSLLRLPIFIPFITPLIEIMIAPRPAGLPMANNN